MLDDILTFEKEWRSVDTDASPESFSQMLSRLRIIKKACECEDLKNFFASDLYWKRLNNWWSNEDMSKMYEYNLKSALIKYFKVMFPNKKRPLWLKLPKIRKYVEGDVRGDYKDERSDYVTKNFYKIYDSDFSKYSGNSFKSARDKMICILGLFAGERRGELRRTELTDFDVNKRLVMVRDSKGGKKFWKPIPEDIFWAELKDYIRIKDELGYVSPYLFCTIRVGADGKYPPISQGGSITNIVYKVGDFVWGSHVFPHIFRHARLTKLSEYYDPFTLKEWVGHKHIDTTMAYIRKRQVDSRVLEIFDKKDKGDEF